MAQIFLSYTTSDVEIAKNVYTTLCNMGYTVWFAPRKIRAGSSFTQEIGQELVRDEMDEADEEKNIENLSRARSLILLLSGASMQSKWVSRELTMAINNGYFILPLRIDHAPITRQYQYKLGEVQWEDACPLTPELFDGTVRERLHEHGIDPGGSREGRLRPSERTMFSAADFDIRTIACGDPYYTYGETLLTTLTPHVFLIAPPVEQAGLTPAQRKWVREHHFAEQSQTFGMTWEEIFAHIPIPDLRERIERSGMKVFQQFLHEENGCYFNNQKYGIDAIRRFGRTEDLRERPTLSIDLYTTDYYTHRVMKDVCKTLVSEGNEYILDISFHDLTYSRIFFTSLGVNLLLLDDSMKPDRELILTSRSRNAAEADYYKTRTQSVSVVEGVSLSDKDTYTGNVNLVFAAERGLLEELGVDAALLNKGTMRFYHFFMNRKNLEMGLSCSVELIGSKSVKKDVLPLHAKDQELETSHKKCIPERTLREYLVTNLDTFMEQAAYALCTYLDANGNFILRHIHTEATHKEKLVVSKGGQDVPCGDAVIDTEAYIAVIDGATPKGVRLWEGMRGDVYITKVIGDAIREMDGNLTGPEAVEYINARVSEAYRKNGVSFDSLPLAETLQASVIVYSAARHEVWSFGDCLLRINKRDYSSGKKLDALMRDLRAFFIELAMVRGEYHYDPQGEDYGRACIEPYLKEQGIFANTGYSFGYDVINGGKIHADNVRIYTVQTGDRVVMATDGYPKLLDTLEESERFLENGLKNDPDCVYELRSTKGVHMGNSTYDDRAFVGFTIDSDN